MKLLIRIILATLFIAIVASAQETIMVPMRDGVRLATDIYRPDDDQPHATILYRTPYNKDHDGLDDETIQLLNILGYVYIAQDCRGRFHSEGVDSVFLNDGWGKLQDGYDTIDWIIKQPWSNGKVGQFGGSATGITTLRAAGSLHPNLLCAAALVAPSDFYSQVVYPGGEFRKSLVENWVNEQGSSYIIPYFLQFPYYNSLWEGMNLHTRTGLMTTPILHIGGWYDCFSEGTVRAFQDLQQRENAGPQMLVMGPWVHGEPSGRRVGEMTYPNAGFEFEELLLRWLGYWLRGFPASVLEEPTVRYYLMGDPERTDEIGCQWIAADTWPPKTTEQLFYLSSDDQLTEITPADSGSFDYTFNPLTPVPTVGGNNLTIKMGPCDQRAVGYRKDVLSFVSNELTSPLRVEGLVRGRLFVSSNQPDTDFTLKLIDVYPDGREMLVTDGIQRARFRDGYLEKQVKLLTPGEIVEIEITLPPTAIVFNSGHRIKIDISSSNYPRYEVNPNTGNEPNDRSNKQPAVNSIFWGGTTASSVILPVVESKTLVASTTTQPDEFHVSDNYPNPFNSATVIEYRLTHSAHVRLAVFDARGRQAVIVRDEFEVSGRHRAIWDGRLQSGEPAPSGVYFYQLTAGKNRGFGKMLLVR